MSDQPQPMTIQPMAIFVRPVSKRSIVRLMIILTICFVVTSLLIMSVQEILDSSAYSRAVYATSGSADDRHRCASLEVFGSQLGKVLVDWDAAAGRRSDGEEPGGASLTEAVRTLTENEMMLEKDNADRLLYLAEILQRYKEWTLQRRAEVGHAPVQEANGEEGRAGVVAEELVTALENVTKNEGNSALPIYMDIYKINRSSYELPTWKLFHNEISQLSLYPEHSALMDQFLLDLVTLPIKSIYPLDDDGTQIKLVFKMDDDSRILFKPKRKPDVAFLMCAHDQVTADHRPKWSSATTGRNRRLPKGIRRDQEESLDLYYMYEMERHTAEIAAFHLDRILGFRRVPPVVGRYIDMIEDIYNIATDELKDTFYKSPIGNECFYGLCEYFCDAGHGICGNGSTLEGSFIAYLPSRSVASRLTVENPWRRSYSKYEEAEWETTDDGRAFCASVRATGPPWDTDGPLLTLIDAHIFDFLTGNKDRHHFEYFSTFGNASSPALFDNGKGFGRATFDVISILAPLYQCCIVRYSTLLRLLELGTAGEGRLLSDLMRQSLSNDVLQGILTEEHLEALDRRVSIVLQHVHDCIQRSSDVNEVVKDVRD